MKRRKGIAAIVAVGFVAAALAAQATQEPHSATKMVGAANDFLSTLTPEQSSQATFAFDDEERLNWHFIPRPRKGLPLGDLEGAALVKAHALIRSGLSEAGYTQTLNIMGLEEVLYLLEGGDREVRRSRRDPQKYYLSIFGTPAAKGDWGWRLEGHHLSLNFTIADGVIADSTPEFYGANPALIDAGPKRKIRVLGPEEDLARQILKLCTAEQQEKAWIDTEAPDDIRGGGVAQPILSEPVGLVFSEMSDDQKELMHKLLTEYLQNLPSDIESRRRAAINKAGLDNVHFGWWGSAEVNERHHYRLQGPSFIVEYNNTQNDANHVHAIWRDTNGDFNLPVN